MKIKLYAFTSIALLALAATACKETTLARISIDEDLQETTVQGAGLISVLPANLSSMKLDVKSAEAYQSEDFDYVTEIKFKSLSFDITASSTDHETDSFEDGDADNFDFISGIELFIKATFDGGEQQTRIAYLDSGDEQLGKASNHLDLKIEDVDILDYVEATDGYEVAVKASGTVPPDDVIFDGKAVYRVGVGFN